MQRPSSSRAPSNTIQDLGIQVDNEGPRRRQETKHSGFLITMNTNYLPKSELDGGEVAERLRSTVRSMLSNEGLEQIVEFLVPGHEFDGETIKNVEGRFVVEKGRQPKGGRIHSHASLNITHTSKIRLSRPAIQEYLKRGFIDMPQVKNFYVNIRAIGHDKRVEDYLTKEISGLSL